MSGKKSFIVFGAAMFLVSLCVYLAYRYDLGGLRSRFFGKSRVVVELRDEHPKFAISLANQGRFNAMLDEMTWVEEKLQLKTAVIVFNDTEPENGFKFSSKTSFGYTDRLDPDKKELVITIFIDRDEVERMGWSMNSVEGTIEYVLIHALRSYEDKDFRGKYVISLPEIQKKSASIETTVKTVQKNIKTRAGLPLLLVDYE